MSIILKEHQVSEVVEGLLDKLVTSNDVSYAKIEGMVFVYFANSSKEFKNIVIKALQAMSFDFHEKHLAFKVLFNE